LAIIVSSQRHFDEIYWAALIRLACNRYHLVESEVLAVGQCLNSPLAAGCGVRRVAEEKLPQYKSAAQAKQGNIHLLALPAGIFITSAGLSKGSRVAGSQC